MNRWARVKPVERRGAAAGIVRRGMAAAPGSPSSRIATERLAGELARYRPADVEEKAALERIRTLLATSPDPFTRARTDHVTGSAVVARPAGEAFLFVYHRRLDRWLQPGGHVEADDATVFETARREALEETGVSAFEEPIGSRILDVDVHPIPASADRPAHVHFDLRHLLTTTAERVAVQSSEVRAARWFTFEEALDAGADWSLARALRKARAALAGRR
jgi:8-oxo-dGTP pyrophosphatase MutT (NUDIX family)